MARATTFDYKVTVVDSGGNKYAIDGNTQQYVVLFPGGTYKFDQADSTNGGHPLRFSETSNGTHNSGSEYTTHHPKLLILAAGKPQGAHTFFWMWKATLPQRWHSVCVLLRRLPNELVPFGIGYGGEWPNA